jgi:hypothetical protein
VVWFVTPDDVGNWTLTIDNLQGSDAKCYRDAVVAVEEAGTERGNPTLTYGAIAFVTMGVIAGFVLLRRRRLGAGDRVSLGSGRPR